MRPMTWYIYTAVANIDANLFLDDKLNGGCFTAGKWQYWSYLLISAVVGHTLISFPFSRLACLHFLFSLLVRAVISYVLVLQ